MKKYLPCIAVGLLAFSPAVHATTDTLSFSTFVSGSSIATAEAGSVEDFGSNSTIAFTYAGNEFVGSVYFDNQLYTTSLSGGSVTKFGSPLLESSASVGEVVVGASLGQAGFPSGNIFVGSGADSNIYQYANSGGGPTLFSSLLPGAGTVRQIFFDPGSTFGGNMLVTTNDGTIYEVNSAGVAILLVNIGVDTEGMDIAPTTWGPYAGYLMVGSEGAGNLRLISPTGVVTVVGSLGLFPGAETVSTVPLNLDGTNSLEGFYVANFATDIQFASAQQFVTQSLLGTVIVTDEGGGSPSWDVAYTGSLTASASTTGIDTNFSKTLFTYPGNQINQFEDGIFVSPERINDVNPNPTPEPSSILLLGTGLLGLAGTVKRKFLS
jgi:hypothetical protein